VSILTLIITVQKGDKYMNSKSEVSMFRIYLLRVMYVFIAVGLAIQKWPGILNPPADIPHVGTVVGSVLGSVTLLAVLGIRYPLKMLPLLFFELVGKSMWVLMWGLPLWSTHQLTPERQETLIACIVGIVLVPLVMPWGYVLNQYVKTPGDPRRERTTSSIPEQIFSSPSQSTTTFRP
jgi:hypothetical protein